MELTLCPAGQLGQHLPPARFVKRTSRRLKRWSQTVAAEFYDALLDQ